ncbi:MAG TPA: alcohol dehydrogenase catalytic domain-containing protein [Candidatus Acidoferrales bacterium]|nr:alcohol dehydrogenase catalytic domain-containing protein [Candidatus Acidoferrales bacterium]
MSAKASVKTIEEAPQSTVGLDLMTAAVLHGREDMRIERVSVPQIAEDEVLVRVGVALTDGTDLKVWKQGFHARMITPPAVFGHELAGTIAAVGSAVPHGVRVGQRVVPANSAPCEQCFYCRKGKTNLCEDLLFNNGAYAEYIRVPGRIVRQNMLEIPDHVSFQDAALAEPLACVLRGIHETGIQPGDTVAVIGCGPIGLKFIRILSQRKASVIAVARRKSQLDLAAQMGAMHVVDASKVDDPAEAVCAFTEKSRGTDAVIEAAGQPATWEWAMQMARKGGTINLFAGCAKDAEVKLDPWALHYSEITVKSTFHHTPRFMRKALDAIARGEIRASDLITATAPLSSLPKIFEQMKERNGQLKTAIVP